MGGSYDTDEQQGSRDAWIRETHDAMRRYKEVRMEVQPEHVRTKPYNVPQSVDYVNRALLQYWENVAPKAGTLGGLWEEEVVAVAVPASGEPLDMGPVRDYTALSTSEIVEAAGTEMWPVTLSNIRRQWSRRAYVRIDFTAHDEWQGPVEETKHIDLQLPVYACDAVFDQLNLCLDDLGWLPGASESDLHGETLTFSNPNE